MRARLAGSSASAVVHAREVDRSIVRVWCMRGTLHLVAADDARWLLALLGPVGLRRNRRRAVALGVDDPSAVDAVCAALADGPLTRHSLAAAARARGVRLADDPQAAVHLVAQAAMGGRICEAALCDGQPTYALWDDWLGVRAGPALERDAALAELARRYVTAHLPAGPEDFASWSGVGVRDARRAFDAIAAEFDEVRVLDRAALVPRGIEPGRAPVARLLPAFDGLLLAHRDRALTVAPEHARDVLPGGGVLRPTLLAAGQVQGTWRLDRGRPSIEPFTELSAEVEAAAAAEATDVVRHRVS